MNLEAYYSGHAEALTLEIAQLKRKGNALVIAQIALFVLFVAFIVLYTVVSWGWPLLACSALPLVGYAVVRRIDGLNSDRLQRKTDLRQVYLHELASLAGDFSAFDAGGHYADARHEYTFDLDVFGAESLFQRMNRTITSGGSDCLADRLSRLDYVVGRAEALAELAAKDAWRADFIALGQQRRLDTEEVMRAVMLMRETRIPGFALNGGMRILAWVAIVGCLGAFVAASLGMADWNLPIWWVILQFGLVFLFTSGTLKRVGGVVDRLHEQMATYIKVVRHIADETFVSALNADDSRTLREAIDSFAQLEQILGGLDRRGNILGLFFADGLAWSDFFLLRRFALWQRDYAGKMGDWLDAVSRVDVRVSMATFSYNHPEARPAEVLTDSREVVCEARGLFHPFLGAKAVRNDFSIVDHHYYIITGANMAGKSTFLRAVGINYILAMNGIPVFADGYRVSIFHLFSSMRTTDDLAHGISYFNAELLRLQQLLQFCHDHRPTLIILDEILKGTNSLDKLNGSRMFLEAISRLDVTGIIATHDLELSKMQSERFHNYCFEIELGADVTYSYKITPGVARNQNATYLLRRILETQ
uniref:MutS family DNA mismatch repair protein n=1 Tax=Prevotella sp. GTC17253 TaxID=3236793 RepID=A0AB33IR86_9BACT